MHTAVCEFSELKITPWSGIMTILKKALLPSPKKFSLSSIISFIVIAIGLNV